MAVRDDAVWPPSMGNAKYGPHLILQNRGRRVEHHGSRKHLWRRIRCANNPRFEPLGSPKVTQ